MINKWYPGRRLVWAVGWCVLVMAAMDARAQPPLTFVGGMVMFEAESFTNNIPRANRAWELQTAPAGFSGSGFMVVTNGADANSNINVNVATTSPELQYGLVIPSVGNYHVWIAAYCESTNEDSVHLGFNGEVDADNPMTFSLLDQWAWGGAARTISLVSTGVTTFSLWMREDGTRIDRIAITTNAAFRPRIGNAWHIPHNLEPVAGMMRWPTWEIFSNTAVTVYNGSQFQGGTNAGNQVTSGSRLYYKRAADGAWTDVPMVFAGESGNNKYHSAIIPAGFEAGDVVPYYFKITYDTFLPTFLATSNGVRFETEYEEQARANAFTFTVLEQPAPGYPSPEDWRNENIYFLMTDRFYDGDPSNNDLDPFSKYMPAVSNRIHGGDFEGIRKKMDYIKALGATAIWITPIPRNTTNSAYHGYAAYDFYTLAAQWGTTNEFQAMTAAAHERGIKVVLDIVANHAGRIIDSGDAGFPAYNPAGNYNLRWTSPAIQYPPPFDQFSHFHAHGDIDNYVDPNQILGELRGLDDLRTESNVVRTNMVEIYKHWIRVGDLDGFRIDTVKHVEMGFWQYFGPAIRAYAASLGKTNFFQFGEVFDGSDFNNGKYTGAQAGGPFAMESVVDYPLYNVINSVFASGSGNTKQIEDRYNALTNFYDPSARNRLVTFIDNHDNQRFLHSSRANNNLNRLNLALTFLYTSRGIPCLYYGTEQYFNGGHDPGNREDMFAGQFEQGPSLGDNFNMTKAGFLLIAQLNNFRRAIPALTVGDHINKWNTPGGPGLFAYSRRLTSITQEVLVALNTSGSSQTLTNRATIHAPGTVMVNLLNTNETITVTAATNTPPVSIPASGYKIFVARHQWAPLDPVVMQQFPAHDAAAVPVTNSIVLTFSKPMNRITTEAAFLIEPPAMGMFTWHSNNTVLVFTPGGPTRLTGEAMHTVRIETNAVDAEHGLALYAPFETRFLTAAAPDTDGDGIPDWWMMEYFNHPTGRVDTLSMAWQDADGDGFTNEEEFIAGTDPSDPASVFRVTVIDEDAIGISSAPGRLYQLEAHVLTGLAWSAVAGEYPGTGGLLALPITNALPNQWYRGRVRLTGGE